MIDRSLNYGRHLIRDFLELAGDFETVLDLGAGKGDDLMIAGKCRPEADLHAIEFHPENVAILSGKGVHVYGIDIEKERFPFRDKELDIIIANQLLEHTKEIFFIFHQISRVLKVGGKVLIGVPNLASLHNRILLLMGKQPSPIKNNSAHVRGFTKGDLLNLLDSCFPGGYEIKAFGGSNFYPFPPPVARPLARLFPAMAWGLFLMVEKVAEYDRQFLEYPVRNRLETNFYLGDPPRE